MVAYFTILVVSKKTFFTNPTLATFFLCVIIASKLAYITKGTFIFFPSIIASRKCLEASRPLYTSDLYALPSHLTIMYAYPQTTCSCNLLVLARLASSIFFIIASKSVYTNEKNFHLFVQVDKFYRIVFTLNRHLYRHLDTNRSVAHSYTLQHTVTRKIILERQMRRLTEVWRSLSMHHGKSAAAMSSAKSWYMA